MEEMIWQEHTFFLDKAPGVGFGIAVGGARDNSGFHSGENSIVISDVVSVGPAMDKLQVNDIIVRINGKPTYNMNQGTAVRELKSCGNRVELTIKRKVFVRVERDTPPPGPLRRSRSRDLDSLSRYHRRRSRSRGRARSPSSRSGRYRSRSRDLDNSSRRRSHSRDLDRSSRRRSRSRDLDRESPRRRSRSRDLDRSPPPRRRSRSRELSPPRSRRGRSYSRSPSYSRRRSVANSFDSRSPSRRGSLARSVDRSWSRSASERSESPPRRSVSPPVATRSRVMRPSSPLSPDKEGATHRGEVMVFPVKSPEPETVVLTKTKMNTSYGLKLGTRIFVQDIQPGSLADKMSSISAGDTVLMINGRNMDNKTVQEAIQTIGLSKDKVTMVVKKQDGGTVTIPATQPTVAPAAAPNHRDSSSEIDSVPSKRSSKASKKSAIKSKTPEPEQPVASKRGGGVKVLPTTNVVASSTSSRTSANSAPKPEVKSEHPEYSLPPDDDDDDDRKSVASIQPSANAAQREIEFSKGKNVGIRLAGGNDVGIFVASVQESSPAAQKGLKMGDQILLVNGVNFRNIIREEAVLTLMGLPAGEFVNIVAQAQPKMYEKILERGTGDSFYIRTHFKYERDGDHEMSFKQGSTFRISDTLYQGMVGYWLGARIGRNNMEIERGVIPNRSRAEQLKMVQDRKIAQLRDRNRGGIGRRIMKNQKQSVDTSSQTSSMFPAYERVVLREAGFKRPVVIFGPLADIARERLAGDHSDLYEIAGNEGIVSGQKSNRKGIIRLNTIKDIIEKDKHAILDITPAAVEKLNYTQLYPIVVFLEAPSKQVVKELRNRLACTDEEKKKKAGKLYDRAVKMQRGYNYVFTDTIVLTAGSDDWYRRLYSTIKDQQSMPVWVSEDKLGGTEEVEGEGVNVPGDDDQFSYVSAPASDYSVTTAGSDMLNSSMRSDEDVTQPKPEPRVEEKPVEVVEPPRRSSSSSSSDEEDAGTQFKDDDFDDDDFDEEQPPLDRPIPPHQSTPPISESPLPEAPPREKKLNRAAQALQQPPPDRVSSSGNSSEAEMPVAAAPAPSQPPIIMPKPMSSYGRGRPKIRGQQEIPPGRFDPQSFLKSHIKGLNKSAPAPVRNESPPVAPVEPTPAPQEEPAPVAPVAAPVAHVEASRHNAYSKIGSTTSQVTTSSLHHHQHHQQQQVYEPVYAQVNKTRPRMNTPPVVNSAPPPPAHQHDRSPAVGRDYGAEIDEFISSDPYRNNRPTPQQPPAPDRYARPQNHYNRFAASSAPKVQPKPAVSNYSTARSTTTTTNEYLHKSSTTTSNDYSAHKSSATTVMGKTNGSAAPYKSKFMQENYKEYMSQVKSNSSSGPTPFQPRPYSKPTAVAPSFPPHRNHHHGIGGKEQMYDSGVDTYDNAKPKKPAVSEPPPPPPPASAGPPDDGDDDAQVVATASGEFDSNGGVLSSVETGVSIVIPKGAIRPGVKQPIYFKVCRDNTALPPLDRERGETLLSPLVMCGPHGLQFDHPVELRLPHCASLTSEAEPNDGTNMDVSSNSVSVLIDHF